MLCEVHHLSYPHRSETLDYDEFTSLAVEKVKLHIVLRNKKVQYLGVIVLP